MKPAFKAWRDRAEASMAARRFGLAAIPGTAGKADETVFSTLRGCLPQLSPAGFELPIDELTWLSSSTTTISDCKRLTMIPFTSDIPTRSMPRRGRLALPDVLGQSDREPRGDEQLRAQRLGLRICGLFEATSQIGVHLSTQKRQRAHRSGSQREILARQQTGAGHRAD